MKHVLNKTVLAIFALCATSQMDTLKDKNEIANTLPPTWDLCDKQGIQSKLANTLPPTWDLCDKQGTQNGLANSLPPTSDFPIRLANSLPPTFEYGKSKTRC